MTGEQETAERVEVLVDEMGGDPGMVRELLKPGGQLVLEPPIGWAADGDLVAFACIAMRQAGVWGEPAFDLPVNHPLFDEAVEAARSAGADEEQAFGAALAVLEGAGSPLVGLFDPVVGSTCRVCGCSDYDACVDIDRGPCGWAAPGLCDSHRGRDLVWALWQLLKGRLRRPRRRR